MPFNQLLLPLLGGYILITCTHCGMYWSSRQSREQLLFAAAFVGALLATLARVMALMVMQFESGHGLYRAVHSVLDYPGLGTALLALWLSLALVWWTNRSWPISEAGFWLYGRGH